MASFCELIEELDDQMMIAAVEDFEVSFYNPNTMNFRKDCVVNAGLFYYRKPKRRRQRLRMECLNL